MSVSERRLFLHAHVTQDADSDCKRLSVVKALARQDKDDPQSSFSLVCVFLVRDDYEK